MVSDSAPRRVLCSRREVLNGRIPPLSRSEASEGQLEPGFWLESDYASRQRCARNHVRLLLRGRRWYESQLIMITSPGLDAHLKE